MQRLKQLGYLIKRRPYALERPRALQFPVNDICNSRCQMCFIWKKKKQPFVTCEEIRTGLSDPLFRDVVHVGLNGGEPTLRKDLGEVTETLFEVLPKLKGIHLITNAFRVEEVCERIKDIGAVTRRHGGLLDVMVSLDGVGAVHDLVRGRDGNFDRACKVIEFVKAADMVDAVRIGCTIVKDNVYGLHDLLDFCIENDLYVKYRLGIPHRRLYTKDIIDPFALTPEEKYHIVEFLGGLINHYEHKESQKFFYRSLMDQMISGAPRKAGCDWQHRGATLSAFGEVQYCAVESDTICHVTDGNLEERYFGASGHLQDILDTKCATCTHDYDGLPPKNQQFKAYAIQALQRFKLYEPAQSVYMGSGLRRTVKARAFSKRARHLESLSATAAMPSSEWRSTVIVCGWYGTETLGDKAILGGIVRGVKASMPDARIAVASLHPYVTNITRRQMPELADAKILTIEEAVQAAPASAMVIFGGGPLMGLADLADMRAIFEAAKRGGRPRVVAGCGVGPLGSKVQNGAIKDILDLADARLFRDEKSKRTAMALGVDADEDAVCEDPAFSWIHAYRDRIETVVRRKSGPHLLLGLRAFPWHEYARHLPVHKGRAVKEKADAALVTTLTSVIDQMPDVSINPVPMCTNHFGGDDRWYYRDLFRSSKEIGRRIDWSLVDKEAEPLAYLDAFAKADAALTMRFHSLVFALAAGVPTVAIDYTLGQGKVASLAERCRVPYTSPDAIEPDILASTIVEMLRGQKRMPLEDRLPLTFEAAFSRCLSTLARTSMT